MELDLVRLEEPLQAGDKLAPENFAENAHREEERCRRSDPSSILGGETSGGNHAVNVRMVTPAPTIP